MHRDSCAGSETSLLAGLVRDVTEEEKHLSCTMKKGRNQRAERRKKVFCRGI